MVRGGDEMRVSGTSATGPRARLSGQSRRPGSRSAGSSPAEVIASGGHEASPRRLVGRERSPGRLVDVVEPRARVPNVAVPAIAVEDDKGVVDGPRRIPNLDLAT